MYTYAMKGKRQGSIGFISIVVVSVVFGFFSTYLVVIFICNWRLQTSESDTTVNKMVKPFLDQRAIVEELSQVLSEDIENGRIGKNLKNPIWEIEYGSPVGRDRRHPVVMIRRALNDDVLQHFLMEPMFSCEESALSSFEGLDNRVKVPFFIYEGYFHSMRTSQPIFSRNPNPLIARDFMKPAATPFLRAFFEAFRIVNRFVVCIHMICSV